MRRINILRIPPGVWVVTGGEMWERSTFKTWAEAMAYADKRVRTIKVTLPRSPLPLKLQGKESNDIVIDVEGSCVSISDKHSHDRLVLNRSDLQPLALALLAQHYDKEQV